MDPHRVAVAAEVPFTSRLHHSSNAGYRHGAANSAAIRRTLSDPAASPLHEIDLRKYWTCPVFCLVPFSASHDPLPSADWFFFGR